VAATWTTCNGTTPQAADTAQISGGNTVTMNTTATVTSLTVGSSSGNNTSTLAFAAGSQLTVSGTVTLSGTNGNRGGATNMTAGGTLIVNSATPFALGSGTVTWTPGTGTVQLGLTNTPLYSAGVFSSFNNLTISANTTTLGGNTTLTGALTATGTLNTSTFTLGVAGNFTVNGTVSGTGAISLSGAGTTITGTGSVTNSATLTITNNKSIAAAASLTLSGPISVSSGTTTNNGTITSTNVATGLTGAGTWTNAAGSTLNISGPLLTAGTLNANANPNTVNYAGAAQTVKLPNGATPNTYYNLSLSGSGAVTMPATALSILGNFTMSGTETTTAAAALTVGGNFTVGAGTTFNASTFTHNVAGDFSRSGTFTASTGTFSFNGSVAQGITGATTFNNLTIANTTATVTANNALVVNATFTLNGSTQFADGGNAITANAGVANSGTHSGAGKIYLNSGSAAHALSGTGTYGKLELDDAFGATLSASPTVSGTLTFTTGNLTTGASNTLTIGSAGSVSGAGTSKHVVGNLAKTFSAATTFAYTVGDGTNYTPITVTFTVAATGNLTAAVTNTDHPDTTSPPASSGISPSKSINRYWTLKGSTITGTYTTTFTFVSGDIDGGVNGVTVSGSNLPNVIVRRGTTCSGATRHCNSWGATTLNGISTTTSASASGISITSGDPEADFVIGEGTFTTQSREREFIFTRELY